MPTFCIFLKENPLVCQCIRRLTISNVDGPCRRPHPLDYDNFGSGDYVSDEDSSDDAVDDESEGGASELWYCNCYAEDLRDALSYLPSLQTLRLYDILPASLVTDRTLPEDAVRGHIAVKELYISLPGWGYHYTQATQVLFNILSCLDAVDKLRFLTRLEDAEYVDLDLNEDYTAQHPPPYQISSFTCNWLGDCPLTGIVGHPTFTALTALDMHEMQPRVLNQLLLLNQKTLTSLSFQIFQPVFWRPEIAGMPISSLPLEVRRAQWLILELHLSRWCGGSFVLSCLDEVKTGLRCRCPSQPR